MTLGPSAFHNAVQFGEFIGWQLAIGQEKHIGMTCKFAQIDQHIIVNPQMRIIAGK